MACALLGTELPIVQAPMAGAQGSALAQAVAAGGGLGSLAAGMLAPSALRVELERLAGRRYNLNFFCHQPPAPAPAHEQRWRELLAPYCREYDLIEPAPPAAVASRVAFDEAMAELVEAFRPAVVSFHFGLPAPALLARVKATGATVLGCATTVAEARALAARGVDGIIAQGLEAGGHRGMFLTTDLDTQMGTLALVPQIVRAIDVPVIAAGGVADTAGVRAALALGASAVQAGTAYLLCPEATTHWVHREALQREPVVTALTNLFTGRPARGIVNRLMRELGALRADIPAYPLAARALAPLRSCAEAAGSGDFSPLWCGQNAQGCRLVPAARRTRELAGLT